MSRNICVYLEFLTEAHRAQIQEAAHSAGFSVRFFSLEEEAAARAFLPECEVLYAHAPELLRAAPATLQWYCCAYAGADPYCKDDGIFANPACLLTNSSGGYGVTIAEHLLMVILMLLRRMPEYEAVVRRREWSNQLPIRSIHGSAITVLGTGNIGTTFAARAKACGAASITGVSRSGACRDTVYDACLPITRLEEILPKTDILVMALPGTPETEHILNQSRLALLPRHAIVVNVGRGGAVDQEALMNALNSGAIAGAALDVMTPEPLPANHPLWDTKNLLLTPHVSGNMTLGYTCDKNVEMFCRDLAHYAAGQPLEHLVDRRVGY
ncbi:MAG: D-2-hydroxyacid dehydrogenase [Oscillibacter sp.]